MIQVFTFPYDWVLQNVSEKKIQEILTYTDISKARRFIHQADHNRYLTARIFLFGWLKKEKIHRSEKLNLSYNSFGKPFLPGIEIQFNWTHSGDMIALILSSVDCGIDIELDTGKVLYDYQSLCTELELNWLDQKQRDTGVSGNMCFMDLWTAKESVVKAKGTGLSVDPRQIEIKHKNNRSERWSCFHESTYYGCTKPITWKGQKYTLSFCSSQKTWPNPFFNRDMVKKIIECI